MTGNFRFFKCERGGGAIIAFVMVLMISILFVGGTFIWQVQSQTQVNALDTSRMDETYFVEPVFSYNKEAEAYSAIVYVHNTGLVPIKLVQAWIIDEDNNDRQHIEISYNLGVDEGIYISEIYELVDSLTQTFDLTTTEYNFKIVTERGNLASSKLMPSAAFQSNWPAIIIPDASYVKKQGANVKIHLEIWNRLDEELHITLIVMSRLGHGSEHSELIHIDWILQPGVISIEEFAGVSKKVYQTGSTCFIEVADVEGTIVSSFYFTCQ